MVFDILRLHWNTNGNYFPPKRTNILLSSEYGTEKALYNKGKELQDSEFLTFTSLATLTLNVWTPVSSSVKQEP